MKDFNFQTVAEILINTSAQFLRKKSSYEKVSKRMKGLAMDARVKIQIFLEEKMHESPFISKVGIR